jgi:thiol-disulfide isomerase/thioredoxin
VAALLALALGGGPPPAAAAPDGAGEGIWARPEAVREALRDHRLSGLGGEDLSLRSLAGEVVVVNFWASWCRPCRRELPALAALHAEIAGRGGRVVAVAIDNERRNVERFVRRHAPGLPVAHDGPDGLARRLDLRHVPLTLVLGRDGRLAFASRGSDAEAVAEVGRVVCRLLDARPAAARGPEEGAP